MPGELILLVDDEANIVELAKLYLEREGFRIASVGDGAQAVEAVKKENPALVVLDIMLPALDGYSIFEALQQECPGKFRVVFTTVHGSEAEQLRGLEAGAIDYMVKPMSLRVALEKIRRWVGR